MGPANPSREALSALVRALPSTAWVAENNGTVLFRRAGRNYLRSPNGQWNEFGDKTAQ